jgi:hypothetical protein
MNKFAIGVLAAALAAPALAVDQVIRAGAPTLTPATTRSATTEGAVAAPAAVPVMPPPPPTPAPAKKKAKAVKRTPKAATPATPAVPAATAPSTDGSYTMPPSSAPAVNP